MPVTRRRIGPGAAFIGSLIGVVASLTVQPRMMLTGEGDILWLLSWTAAGGAAGLAIERFVARGTCHLPGSQKPSPSDVGLPYRSMRVLQKIEIAA